VFTRRLNRAGYTFPTRTIKILGSTPFQWIEFISAAKEFSGGGTYTENKEFLPG
jgi:hypothetical protein